ncbi:MAG: hypothetical protein FWH42_01385 [Dehalococcoidia bacterium]|nr:hypothetical protein [Dehalococcoidia bacterium]
MGVSFCVKCDRCENELHLTYKPYHDSPDLKEWNCAAGVAGSRAICPSCTITIKKKKEEREAEPWDISEIRRFCPFCGYGTTLIQTDSASFKIRCDNVNCHACITKDTKEQAITAWNKRVEVSND